MGNPSEVGAARQEAAAQEVLAQAEAARTGFPELSEAIFIAMGKAPFKEPESDGYKSIPEGPEKEKVRADMLASHNQGQEDLKATAEGIAVGIEEYVALKISEANSDEG